MTVSLSFDIVPQGKGRPRSSHAGGVFRTHTPAKTVAYERTLRDQAALQIRGHEPLSGPLYVSMAFYFPQKTKKRHQTPKATKPDIDNLVKAVADALNGIVWHDDNQIARILAGKEWAAEGRIDVIVQQIGRKP